MYPTMNERQRRKTRQDGDSGISMQEITPQTLTTPLTFSPFQVSCVQLRRVGYLQATGTSMDKMS